MKMKKLLIAGIALATALSVQADLLSNPGLEGGTGLSDIPDWTSWGSSGTLEGGYYHGGSQSVRTWWNDTGFYQDFTATEGENYELTGYMYSPSGGDNYTWDGGNQTYACIRMEWRDSGDGLISSVDSTHFTPDNAADVWTEVTASGVAPAGTAVGRVVFLIDGAGPGGGTVAFDDIDVTAVAVPEPSTIALIAVFAGVIMAVRKRRA
jgi:hypothetical protein